MPSPAPSPAAHPTPRPDPSLGAPARPGMPGVPGVPRAAAGHDTVGALWVAALGAFLVIVGAATFVAVRWDEIPSTTKLGALVAVTAGCLATHRLLRATLPVTALVLLHLGVLLTPIDVAAVGVGLAWRWPLMLLTIGLATAAVPQVAPRRDRTVVLRLVSGAGVVLVAGGLGALTGAPAGLLLAATALAAVLVPGLGRGTEAVAWATLAGLAVPLAAGAELGITGAGVLADLGLAGVVPPAVAALTGLLAGVTLAVSGRRHDDVALALLGLAAVATGAVTAWYRLTPGAGAGDPELTIAAAAALTLLTEVAARAWRADEFWGRVTDHVAMLGEAVAVVVTAHLVGALLAAPGTGVTAPAGALTGVLTALTWLVAVTRHPLAWGLVPDDRPLAAAGWGYAGGAPLTAPTPPGPRPLRRPPVDPVRAVGPAAAVVAAAGGIALATATAWATGLTLGVLAALVLVVDPAAAVGRRGARANGVVAAGLLAAVPAYLWWAADAASPAGEAGWAGAAAVGGAAGALVIAACTVRALRSPDLTADEVDGSGALFAALALAPVATGAGVVADLAGTDLAVAFAVVVLGAVAAVLDRLDPRARAPAREPPAAAGARGPARRVAHAHPGRRRGHGPADRRPAAGRRGSARRADAAGRRRVRRHPGRRSGGAGPGGLGRRHRAGGHRDRAGVARARAQPAAALRPSGPGRGRGVGGLRAGVERARRPPAGDQPAGRRRAHGRRRRRPRPAPRGGGRRRPGHGWAVAAPRRRSGGGVGALRAAGGGVRPGRRRRGPAPGARAQLVGDPRPGGGAGGRGGAGRAAGRRARGTACWPGSSGSWRSQWAAPTGWSGPLLAGTTLVVAVSIHETLGVTARVPTWVWLCTGGLALLAAGVGMERRDVGPVDAGRRVVDVLRTRYS